MQDLANTLFGLGADDLTIPQVITRTVIVYICALAMVRLGEKRFIGKNTAFDVIVGIMLGSVVSSAVTSTSEFFTPLVAGAMIVILHLLLSIGTFFSDRFGDLVKGQTRVLVENGAINWDQMKASHYTRQDLLSALRRQGNTDDLDQVRTAKLERNGDISVLIKEQEPKVVSVEVQAGVQRVVIEMR